jgi:hypothetical protein
MPRTESANLTEIFKAYRRRDTLNLYLNNNTVLNLSRGAVTRGATVYNNSIASVEELRYSIDTPVDRVTINCQNVNSLLGFNLASNLRLLDYAIADYGRQYQSLRNPSLVEDYPQYFRGVLANAEADETRIGFELIVDYESLGAILASRGLSPRCWWLYKNGIECTSSSAEPDCPKTRDACGKRHNSTIKDAEHGGWEYFEEPTQTLPGDGENDGGGIGGGTCFTGDTLILTPGGEIPFAELLPRFQLGLKSIYSFNPHTGEVESDEIEEIFVHQATGHFTFALEHATVKVTPEHPFLIDWGLFKPADGFSRLDTTKAYINAAEHLSSAVWRDSKLLKIKWHSDVRETVYNCRVKKNATYFANRCGVHNRKNEEILLV